MASNLSHADPPDNHVPTSADHELRVMIGGDLPPQLHDQRGQEGRGGVGERVRHLRVALPICGALLIVAGVVAWAVRGPAGAAGAAVGVALVVASYTASTLAIAWADSVNPRLVLPVGMGMYVTKFSLFGAMMIAVSDIDWPGFLPMAMGIIAAVVAWTATQIWWTVRTAYPYVDNR